MPPTLPSLSLTLSSPLLSVCYFLSYLHFVIPPILMFNVVRRGGCVI
jgi:hypothetical protein